MVTAEGKGATTTATATKATSTTRAANTGGSEYVIEGEREEEEEEDTMPGGHGGGWQQLKDEKKGAAAGMTRGSGDDDLAIEMQETRSSRATTGTAAALAAGAARDAGEGGTTPGTTEYRVYKRRWFGLVQLTLLNIIVSWDVSLALFFILFFALFDPGIGSVRHFPSATQTVPQQRRGPGAGIRAPTFYTRRSRGAAESGGRGFCWWLGSFR
jgi:hypothetical protein